MSPLYDFACMSPTFGSWRCLRTRLLRRGGTWAGGWRRRLFGGGDAVTGGGAVAGGVAVTGCDGVEATFAYDRSPPFVSTGGATGNTSLDWPGVHDRSRRLSSRRR